MREHIHGAIQPTERLIMGNSQTICLFSTLYPPSMGGVQTYTASLADALRDKGFRVVVFACNTHGMKDITEENDIEIIRIPCHNVLGGRYPIPKVAASRPYWEKLKKQHVDYIVINTRFYPLSIQALAFAENLRIKPIVIEHGSAHLTMGNPVADRIVETAEHVMTKRCLRYPAQFYGVSKKASAWLNHFSIFSQGELPNAINADKYIKLSSGRDFRQELCLNNDDLLVSFIGRLVPEKGVQNLAKASQILAHENIVFALGGDGPLREDLKRKESKTFRILGRLNRSDTAALLLQSDLMCLPSRSEGFSTTLLEAAACGTPSLVTNVGGTDELIPNSEYGTILPDSTPGTISKAILEAKSDLPNIIQQGFFVRQLVENEYSWESTAAKLIDACERAQQPS